MTLDQIVAEIDRFPASYVVLTGGEPMVAKGIHELANRLKEKAKHITIETAATIPPDGIACDLASLSPKLSNSTPNTEVTDGWRDRHEKRRLQPEIIRAWLQNYNYQLKFVISAPSDLDEIQDLLVNLQSEIKPGKVLLMPEGTELSTMLDRAALLVDICKRYGYRYCNRLHIELFGNTKGT